MTIRAAREDGSFDVPAFVVPAEHVDDLLRRLSIRRKQQRDAAAGQVPPATPKKIPRCLQRRDGGARRYRDGCRRHEGHRGQCRDAHGDYRPAICCHIGFPRAFITTPEGAHIVCGHCGARVPR